MPDVLFTVLGGVNRDTQRTYQTANYMFPDGIPRKSSYFATALLDHLRDRKEPVGKLVVLGTNASFWDELLHLVAPNCVDLRTKLLESARKKAVNTELVRQLEPIVSEKLNVAFEPLLIPYCDDASQALQLVKTLSEKVKTDDTVMFDITHGLRHLPLIGLMAAILIESLRSATVSAVWYGGYEMRTPDDHAPVLNLAGVLELVRWLRGLSAYDASGDLRRLAPVLQQELGDGATNDLRLASIMEQMLDFQRARQAARNAREAAGRLQGPVASLFRKELEDRFKWCTFDDLAEAQYELSREFLYRGNLQSASIVAYEAIITWLMTNARSPISAGADPTDRRARQRMRERAVGELRGGPGSLGGAFHDARMIRNWLAHGDPPTSRRIRAAHGNPRALEELLRTALARIFDA